MITSRQWLQLSLAFAFVLIGTTALLPIPWFDGKTMMEEVEEVASPPHEEQTYHLVTTEFETRIGGKVIEVYRWDPGTLVLHKGDRVRLVLHGIHGKEHHFTLEGYNQSGTVKKGQTTTIRFEANQTGTFRLICHNHHQSEDKGPMVAYITVLDQESP
ncbi:cupredoxin domain-containing protein [Desmospora profundinema]|uniref:Plastocyanin n=1 Tax=Desmospora profundinema TaxID=1571184 RepID=A0ABU1IHC1_9BACL|nr:cupredoxin domain-containing protein [Desmospora profundinema]MDR6224176.1 plastocyanin [Desmospora profundinema]